MIFENMYICQYCGKECKNLNSLRQHEIRCKENPNKIKNSFEQYNNDCTSGNKKHLNRYSSNKQNGCKYIDNIETKEKLRNVWLGKKHKQETKHKISESRKKYLDEHPDKVPFLLNHSSKISYPEQYFIDIFEKENIPLKYHKQVHRYELDFYNENLMKYVEIDGEQHYLDWMIEHDKERDKYLSDLGWTGIRIRWSEYQLMNDNDKHQIVENIRQFIQ